MISFSKYLAGDGKPGCGRGRARIRLSRSPITSPRRVVEDPAGCGPVCQASATATPARARGIVAASPELHPDRGQTPLVAGSVLFIDAGLTARLGSEWTRTRSCRLSPPTGDIGSRNEVNVGSCLRYGF